VRDRTQRYFAVLGADDGVLVAWGELDDAVVAPYGGDPAEEGRRKAYFEHRRRLVRDASRDAGGFTNAAVGVQAAVGDRDAAVIAERVGGGDPARALLLETVGQASNLVPGSRITRQLQLRHDTQRR
jgi:hypothetical protein